MHRTCKTNACEEICTKAFISRNEHWISRHCLIETSLLNCGQLHFKILHDKNGVLVFISQRQLHMRGNECFKPQSTAETHLKDVPLLWKKWRMYLCYEWKKANIGGPADQLPSRWRDLSGYPYQGHSQGPKLPGLKPTNLTQWRLNRHRMLE